LAAVKILAALVASPQRYAYIENQIELGKLNNFGATEKNVTKSIMMADQLVKGLKAKNKLDR